MSVSDNDAAQAAERARYKSDASLKYVELAEKLRVIKERMKFAIDNDTLVMSESLAIVQHQAETQLATVKRRIERLNGASKDSWDIHKQHLESGWEDLMRSIQNFVSRISRME